mgnify:CR=1 FL=1
MNIKEQIIMAAFDDELEKLAKSAWTKREKQIGAAGTGLAGLAGGAAVALAVRNRGMSKSLMKSLKGWKDANKTTKKAISQLKGSNWTRKFLDDTEDGILKKK